MLLKSTRKDDNNKILATAQKLNYHIPPDDNLHYCHQDDDHGDLDDHKGHDDRHDYDHGDLDDPEDYDDQDDDDDDQGVGG